MPLLAADFQFSQASLQDFVDCRRRFWLRYARHLAWPAVEVEPIEEQERRVQQGLVFHQMVHQHLVGVPEEVLTRMAVDPDLERWWRNYRVYHPVAAVEEDETTARYPEVTLAATLEGHRLLAKFDLLVVTPGAKLTIFDWKTSSRLASAANLQQRLQTRVYRYLLVRAGAHFNAGDAPDPEQVELIYWYPEFPESPVRLPYSAGQYQEDATYLSRLIALILELDAGSGEDVSRVDNPARTTIEEAALAHFPMTEDERRCTYCLYRSFCDRGVTAGNAEAIAAAEAEAAWVQEDAATTAPSPDADFDIDFEQIAEIEF